MSEKVHRLNISGQSLEAAQMAKMLLKKTPDSAELWLALCEAENQNRNYDASEAALEKAKTFSQAPSTLRKYEARLASDRRDYANSVKIYQVLIQENPNSVIHLNGLKVGYFGLGRFEEAREAGEKALAIADERSMDRAPAGAKSFKPKSEGRSGTGGERVAAFSLWGRAPAYLVGAMVNARMLPLVMPGWRCRFYLDEDVPESVTADLSASGAEVIRAREAYPGIARYNWRFLIADDRGLEAFLCRDCDSRPTAKEWTAVEDWLASGKAFHVMRDHIVHNDLILAGLWGGLGGTGIEMQQRIEAQSGDQDLVHDWYGADQKFLGREIWPSIRAHSLTHDSHYSLANSRPFPFGWPGDDRAHVGMGLRDERHLRQDAKRFGLPWPIPGADQAKRSARPTRQRVVVRSTPPVKVVTKPEK